MYQLRSELTIKQQYLQDLRNTDIQIFKKEILMLHEALCQCWPMFDDVVEDLTEYITSTDAL